MNFTNTIRRCFTKLLTNTTKTNSPAPIEKATPVARKAGITITDNTRTIRSLFKTDGFGRSNFGDDIGRNQQNQ